MCSCRSVSSIKSKPLRSTSHSPCNVLISNSVFHPPLYVFIIISYTSVIGKSTNDMCRVCTLLCSSFDEDVESLLHLP